MRSKKPEKRLPPRRRDEFLAVATKIFHEKGFDAASMQDVADALDIRKGSLYHYITSKEELLFEIVEQVHRETFGQLLDLLRIEGNALVKMRAMLRWQILVYCRDVEKVGVFLYSFRSLSPKHQAKIIEERDQYDQCMRDLIRLGQSQGVISADVDPKLTTMAIFGILNWISTWWRRDGSSTSEELAEQFTDFILSGLATRDGTPRARIGALPPLPFMAPAKKPA